MFYQSALFTLLPVHNIKCDPVPSESPKESPSLYTVIFNISDMSCPNRSVQNSTEPTES